VWLQLSGIFAAELLNLIFIEFAWVNGNTAFAAAKR
jgi:hypothetical protein